MKIGINASFARKTFAGIGQVTTNFLKELAKIKVTHEFYLYLEEDINFKLSENFTKRIFLPFYKRDDLIRKIWWEKYLLPKKAKEDNCDILLSLYQCPTVTSGLKHLMLVHDIIPKLFPEYLNNSRKEFYWKATERAIRKADKIMAVSKRTEKDVVKHIGIDAEKISVNYIDVDSIYKLPISSEKSLRVLEKFDLRPGYILAGGGMEVRKNIEGVIRAYHWLLGRNKKLGYVRNFPDLVISGKLTPQLAPLSTDAEKLVKKLNLSQRVRLIDFIEQEDLPALYRNAEFFVYPSFYEGFGLPVLEAMNVGTPVITSKKSSLPEVGSDAVLYCRPDEIEDIAMVMKTLLINKQLREKLSERGRERAKYFSWEKFAGKALNIINERDF